MYTAVKTSTVLFLFTEIWWYCLQHQQLVSSSRFFMHSYILYIDYVLHVQTLDNLLKYIESY